MAPLLFLLFLDQHGIAAAGDSELTAAVVKFWGSRGWKAVAVVSLGDQERTRSSRLKWSLLKRCQLGTRLKIIVEWQLVESNMFPRTVEKGQTDHVTILITEKPNQMQKEILIDVLMRSAAFSVLVVSWVSLELGFLRAPVGFYLIRLHSGSGRHISRIIATRQQSMSNLRLRESNELFPPDVLPGTYMKIVTLPYEPFLFMDDCSKDPPLPCKSISGSLIDVMKYLSSEGNFTFDVFLEPSGKWDDLPESPKLMNGSMTKNSSLLGSVYFGSNDLPLSTWAVNSKRKSFAEFTFSIGEEQTMCFASAQQIYQGSSTKFLFQPLTKATWRCIMALTALVVVGIALLSCFKMLACEGAKTWMAVGGLAYTVAMAYYSGGQTMFLVSKPEVPFNDIISGALSEDWKVIVANGDETMLSNLYPIFAKENPRIRSLVENFKAHPKTMKQVLQELNLSRTFLAALKSRVAYFLQKYPDSGPGLLVPFCTPRTSAKTFLIPHSSPFKYVLNKGIKHMRMSGAMEVVWRRWHRLRGQEEMGIPGGTKPRSLTFWKVAWVFQMGGVIIACVLLLLAIEKIIYTVTCHITLYTSTVQ